MRVANPALLALLPALIWEEGRGQGGDLNAAAIARELEQLTYLLLFSNRGDDSSLFRNSKINGCWFYLSEIKKKIGAKFENV